MPHKYIQLTDLNMDASHIGQWTPVVGEEPSAGKQAEDRLIYPHIIKALKRRAVNSTMANHQYQLSVAGIIADEGRLELEVANQMPDNIAVVSHFTMGGAFAEAAKARVLSARQQQVPGANKVDVHETIDDQDVGLYDVVVMNLILGCLANEDDISNISITLQIAEQLLNEHGQIIVVRPNPEGRKFETYEILSEPDQIKEAHDFQFGVKGLFEMGNLYTSNGFLKRAFDPLGFGHSHYTPIYDSRTAQEPAFHMDVYRRLRPGR